MAKLTVKNVDVRGKRVFLRVDYNVPLEEKDGQMVITDATRIVETLPTLKLLMEKGGKLILTAHLGRPKGKREATMSLAQVAVKLSELLGKPVTFVEDCIGEKVERVVAGMQDGDVVLLENVRYYNEEEKNDPAFAEKLASELATGRDRPLHDTLSDREYKVMWLLASGKHINEIAEEIFLSPSTISTYRARILKKLGLANNAELVRYAVSHRLI